ncbi:hypothetical protein [Streptosporangium sp. NPDC002721]|uniref:hypothetical protein n=1 Tax=Streptosporangium sp. NPDC002721 TaxID=3366188 RepID=UPI00368000D7
MSIKPDGTMLAALYGELAPHPWRDPLVAPSDAYSLFVARSSAMGWLAEATERVSGGLWGMNDAGQAPASGPGLARVAWFQVVLTGSVPADRPLPVQAFLACVDDVVARVGTAHPRAVRVLLPVQSLEAPVGTSSRVNAVMTLLQDAGWFADGDPRLRAGVRVTLDGGQDPSIGSAAPGMLRWMREFDQDVFSCDPLPTDDDDVLAVDDGPVLEPAVIDEVWRGSGHHRVTFHGVLAEWSPAALGWLAAFLAEAGFQHGIATPLMLTVGLSSGPDPRAG